MENICVFFKPSTSDPHNLTSLSPDVHSFPLNLSINPRWGLSGELSHLYGSFAGIQTIQWGANPLLSQCPSTKKEICFRAFPGGVTQKELQEKEDYKKLKEKVKELEER